MKWIESVTGESFCEDCNYEETLQDGILLCKLINAISPGAISKINTGGGHLKMVENTNRIQVACKKYGVPDGDIFQTTDLSEKKDIAAVTTTIFALGSAGLGSARSLHRKTAEISAKGNFRAGDTVIGLQAGTNRGANQSGLSIGATRKILLGK